MWKRASADSSGDRSNSKSSKLEDGSRGGARRGATRSALIMYKESEPLLDLASSFERDGGAEPLELWGCDVYTEDSDIVAVLVHCGYWSLFLAHPPAAVAEVRVLVRTKPPQACYPSVARNSIRSRAWAAPISGCSYSVERAWIVLRSGQTVDLVANLRGLPAAASTFTPSHHERIVTRSAGGSARQRALQEVTLVFNLANEPWVKYCALAVADRGLRPHERTSARMLANVLYLESHTHRYELARVTQEEGAKEDTFKFSRCAVAEPRARMAELGAPLPADCVTVLYPDLTWEELQWGQQGVLIRDRFFTLIRLQFVPGAEPTAAGTGSA